MKDNNNYTMAQTFNFETRELVPYRNDWNRGGNVNASGVPMATSSGHDGRGCLINRAKETFIGKIHSDYL